MQPFRNSYLKLYYTLRPNTFKNIRNNWVMEKIWALEFCHFETNEFCRVKIERSCQNLQT